MCMEDIRLGRKTQSLSSTVSLAGGVTQIVAYNPSRIALAIGVPPGGLNLGISMNPNMAANTGINIDPLAGPVIFNVQQHGRMALGPWYSASGGGAVAEITETLLDEK